MFTTISWGNYVIAIGTLLFIWYLFLGFQFYSFEIKQTLLGQRKFIFPNFGIKKKNDPLFSESQNGTSDSNLSESFSESFATLDEVKELSARLVGAIAESAQRNLSRQEFTNYLRLILTEYPYVKISSLRGTVNDLVVSESEKYTDLLLKFQQVEDLWEEPI